MKPLAIRVALPYHLQNLAKVGPEIILELESPVTIDRLLDSLESKYPMLKGTIRLHETRTRRPLLRYFACQKDISHDPTDQVLPQAIVDGTEPLIILGRRRRWLVPKVHFGTTMTRRPMVCGPSKPKLV